MRSLILTTLLMLSSPLVHAYEQMVVGAEALCWKPATCNYDYAQIGNLTAAPFADRIASLEPNFDVGFRVFANCQRQCWNATISYLYLKTHDTSTSFRGDADSFQLAGLVATNYTRGQARLDFEYQYIDVSLARLLLVGNRWLKVSCSANGRWIDLDRKARLRGTGATLTGAGTIEQVSETQGGCFGLGLQAETHCNCLTAFLSTNLMACIETARIRRFERDDIHLLSTRLKYGAVTYPAPAADFQIGLSATTLIGCLTLSVEIGFDCHYYWNALRYAVPTRINEPIQEEPVSCRDIGFAGPHLGLRGQF